MRIQIARTAADMDRLRGLWDSLYASTRSATLFQSFAWNRLAAECFAAREAPYVVAVDNGAGAAIIPAAVGREGMGLLGEQLFDYRDVLCAGDPGVLAAAWRAVAELRMPMKVTALRGEDACQRWSGLNPAEFVQAPAVCRTDISADEFVQAHPRLGRTLRRMAQHGVTLHHRCGSGTGLVRWIYAQKAAQEGVANNLFRDAARVDFMVGACAMAGDGCDIYALQLDERPIAALVTFRDRDVRRFYTVWFDGAWAAYSPGTALCFEVTRRSLQEGLDCDYMTGEQLHKTRFATSATPLFRVDAVAEVVSRAAGEVEEARPLAA